MKICSHVSLTEKVRSWLKEELRPTSAIVISRMIFPHKMRTVSEGQQKTPPLLHQHTKKIECDNKLDKFLSMTKSNI